MFLTSYIIDFVERHLGSASVRPYLDARRQLGRPGNAPQGTPAAGAALRSHLRGALTAAAVSRDPQAHWPRWIRVRTTPGHPAFAPFDAGDQLLNTTARSWTGIGHPSGRLKAVVDSHGALAPRPDSWSIEVHVTAAGMLQFPPPAGAVPAQSFTPEGGILTEWASALLAVALHAWPHIEGDHETVVLTLTVTSRADVPLALQSAFLLRPAGPEGVEPVPVLAYNSRGFFADGEGLAIHLPERPASFLLSSREGGDIPQMLSGTHPLPDTSEHRVACAAGLAQAAALYDFTLKPGASAALSAIVPLQSANPRFFPFHILTPRGLDRIAAQRADEHAARLAALPAFRLPSEAQTRAADAALRTMLLLLDAHQVTAGPRTGHAFTFRTAAAMVPVLLDLGLHRECARLLGHFPLHQWKNGYFCTGKGAWASTGQALHVLEYYAARTGDLATLEPLYRSVQAAAQWIERKRHDLSFSLHKPRGLMPAGLSPDGEGPTDCFYADNFWSLAGLHAAASLAERFDRPKHRDTFRHWAASFRQDLDAALHRDMEHSPLHALPAAVSGAPSPVACLAHLDAADPLALASAEGDAWFASTLRYLADFWSAGIGATDGAWPSAEGAPVAELWQLQRILLAVDPEAAARLEARLLAQMSSSACWPRVLHPTSGEGFRGDAHCGLAAAQYLNSLQARLLAPEGNGYRLLPHPAPGWLVEGAYVEAANLSIGASGRLIVRAAIESGSLRLSAVWAGSAPPPHLTFAPAGSDPVRLVWEGNRTAIHPPTPV